MNMSHTSIISRKKVSTTETREQRVREFQRRCEMFDDISRRFLHARLTNDNLYTQRIGKKNLMNQYEKIKESIGPIAGIDFSNLDYVAMSATIDSIFFHNTRKGAIGIRYKNLTDHSNKKSIELMLNIQAFLRVQEDKTKVLFLLFADIVISKEEIVVTFPDEMNVKTLEDAIFKSIISIPDFEPKSILLQLIEGAEFLNQMGIAHRYIRKNSVLVNLITKNIKISFFDCACVFWCVETRAPIMHHKSLPVELHQSELDHLPPEFFSTNYDATHIDSWSIGVIGCLLIACSHPFNPMAPEKMYNDWLDWSERMSFPEELRTFMDDVFIPFTNRIPLWEMLRDRRLTLSHKRAILEPQESFVRVESLMSLRQSSDSSMRSFAVSGEIDWTSFSPDIEEMFNHNGLKTLESLDNAKIRYEKEQIYEAIPTSQSLLATYEDKCVEVRMVMLKKIPLRAAQLLTLETHRILSFISKRPDIPSSYQKVIQIFKVKENLLYVFIYEPLGSKLSLYELALKSKISTRNMRWMIKQMIDLIVYFEKFGVAHRYITPENIFLVTNTLIKLKASEMACFTINPKKRKRTARKRGLQDEQQAFWKHLPPDCFNTLYDASKVDIWSTAVVQVFCLTGGMWPFEKKLLIEGIDACKLHYIQNIRHLSDVSKVIEILDRCFIDQSERITPKKLDAFLKNSSASL